MAFSAGLLSFISPCVLPLIPAYLSYIAGSAVSDIKNRTKTSLMLRTAFFVLGFSLVFILLGATVSVVSRLFSANLIWFKRIGGIMIFVLGLHLTGLVKIRILYSERRLLTHTTLSKGVGPFLLGMAFAAGWTPCVGPILSSILIYAAGMATVAKGILLLLLYSLGLGVPFLLTALLAEKLSRFLIRFSKYLPFVSVVAGIMLMGMGILIFTNQLTILSRFFSALSF